MVQKPLIVFIMVVSDISAYTTCLSCKDIVHARDCSTIERCGPFSSCYIDGYFTSLGYIRYNVGCRDTLQCISDDSRSSGRSDEEEGNHEFCSECCIGDLCNSRGCRDTGYQSAMLRGPVCFNCPDQQVTNDCQAITVCPLGNVCKLKRILYGANSELRYESKCENRQKCNADVDFYKKPWAAVGRKRILDEFQIGTTCMIQCCDADLCNVGCNATSVTPSSTSTLPSTSTMSSPVKKPSIKILPYTERQLVFQLGSSINLTCESPSFPTPNITWTFKKNTASDVVINRKTLTFISLQPSQIGNYTCTARNVYGFTSRTISILSNVTGALDCDFESIDTCLWKNNPLAGGMWSNSGVPNHRTAAVNLDPALRNVTGSFLYASVGDTHSAMVMDLISPELGPSGPACLSFLHFCHGDTGHQIQVEIVTSCEDFTVCNSSKSRTIIIAGSSGPTVGWSLAQIPLAAIPHVHNLIIRSTHVHGTRQEYCAIDDVKYYDDDCKPSMQLFGPKGISINVTAGRELRLTCQIHGFPMPIFHWSKQEGCGKFDSSIGSTALVSSYVTNGDAGTYTCTASNGRPLVTSLSQTFHVDVIGPESETLCTFEHGLCGWTQSRHDDFDWTLASNYTPSANTGPMADHTMGNSSGFYMYIETSSPRRPEEAAVLRSPRLAGNQSACISFYYHMAGIDIGQLTLSSQDTCTGVRNILFHANGEQGPDWLFHAVNIPARSVRHDYHVDILATVGASYHGDIAVDDIRISHDVCS